MIKKITGLISIIILLSCSEKQNSYFSENNYNCLVLNEKSALKGEKIIDNLIGINDFDIVDDYIILTTPQEKYIIQIYNLLGDSISAFGIKGNGPNDLINCQLNGQKEKRGGESFIWINDISSAKLKELNITESITSNSCVFDKDIRTYPYSSNAFYINDSLIIIEYMSENNYQMTSLNPILETEIKSEQLYKPSFGGVFSYYKSLWRISDDSKKMVSAMYSINEINFLDRILNYRFSCLIGSLVSENEIVDPETKLEKHTYYCDLKTTNKYIYALYMDQPYEISYEKEKPMEIHVFNWKGEFIKHYIVSEYILRIAVNNYDNVIYGLAQDSAIYKYDIID